MNVGDAPHASRPDDVKRAEILTGLLSDFMPGRCIDLGCGLGWYTRIPADQGWQATGIDARDRDWEPYPGCTFVQQDVRDADLSGYDLILCLGLLYHMTFEDQMALLAKCAHTPLIIDTHVMKEGSNKVPLEPATLDGYTGGLYAEGRYAETSGTLASWGNSHSFWPTEYSLTRMLEANGYATVVLSEPWWAPDRTFWTCLP